MDGIILTPLKQIHHLKGNVYHGMKKSDNGFYGFGEAYFSTIYKDDIKGWKKHTKMVLNLVVVSGEIEFVAYNEEEDRFFSIILSHDNYQRLTVLPNIWLAFRGVKSNSMLLNVASLEHDPSEAISKNLEEIHYAW